MKTQKLLLPFILLSLYCFRSNAQSLSIKNEKAEKFLIDSCYSFLGLQYPFGASLYIDATILGDEAVCGGQDQNDLLSWQELDKFSFTSSNETFKNLWNKYYTIIKNCNFLIDYAQSSQTITAEAKFLRAISYFDLVRLFDKVPILSTTKIPFKQTLIQSSANEVYQLIESDLTDAASVLPSKSALSNERIFHASKGAAEALLGKVYLYEQNWQDAVTEFSNVINSNQYSLLANYADLWNPDNDFNQESVFEINFVDTVSWGWNGINHGNLMIHFMGIKNIFNSNQYSQGFGFAKVNTSLKELFSEKDSVRLKATIIDAEKIKNEGVTFSDPYQYTGYYNAKYACFKEHQPSNQYMWSKNEVLIRYADVLLMMAEAQYHLGNEMQARIYLNQVRSRVGLDEITSSGANLLNDIYKERQFELALEGHRYFDLVRWGKAANALSSFGFKSETNGLMPIPREVIETNHSFIQNTGYLDTAAFSPSGSNTTVLPLYSTNGIIATNIDSIVYYKYNLLGTDSIRAGKHTFVLHTELKEMEIPYYSWNRLNSAYTQVGYIKDSISDSYRILSSKGYTFSTKNVPQMTFRNDYEYDNNGYQIASIYFGGLSSIATPSMKFEDLRDQNGYDTAFYVKIYDAKKKLWFISEYAQINNYFNGKSKPDSMYRYHRFGATGTLSLTNKENYFYNNVGHIIKRINYYNQGDGTWNITIDSSAYIYNANNQIIEEKRLSNIGTSNQQSSYHAAYGLNTSNLLIWSGTYSQNQWLDYEYLSNKTFTYYKSGDVKVSESAINKSIQLTPNPVSESTNLSFILEQPTLVKLKVYNVDGKLIEYTDLGYRTVGINKYNFNAHRLANGMYYLVVETNNTLYKTKLIVKK